MWLSVTDPWDIAEVEQTERISVDLPASEHALLERFAAYRNALAAVQGKKLGKRWTRKAMAEHVISLQCQSIQHQLAEMTKALGPLPEADNKPALEKYARRVVEWTGKNGKK